MNIFDNLEHHANAQELLAIIALFHQRGWSPATSTNYSFRNPQPFHHTYTISKSGIDKSRFTIKDLMLIDEFGKPLPSYQGIRPSAETLLHTVVYDNSPETRAILHTHSPVSTIFSMIYKDEKVVKITGFEVLKALKNITTHEQTFELPIFANSQDMPALSEEIDQYYAKNPDMSAFLLVGHGIYAWGNSMTEAKRYVEALDFLMDCMLKLRLYKN